MDGKGTFRGDHKKLEYRLRDKSTANATYVEAVDISTNQVVISFGGLLGFMTYGELERLANDAMFKKGYRIRQRALHEAIDPAQSMPALPKRGRPKKEK